METIIRMEADPLLKLSTVEELMRKKKLLVPVPHRKTLVAWIISGKWEGKQDKENNVWYVRQSSFVRWAKALQESQTATV